MERLTEVTDWLIQLSVEANFLHPSHSSKGTHYFYLGEGLWDKPHIYISPQQKGIVLGYEFTKWDGYLASDEMGNEITEIIPWEVLEDKRESEKISYVSEKMNNTISNRESMFVKCKFCKAYFPPEHIIMGNVCHTCASKHLQILF